MLSKNPIDLPPGRKFTREELAQALRLSIIAELDAINLYTQLASFTEDQAIRRVFEDIAKEEKTHVGEFLALLKTLDQEQVEELSAGAEEVAKLTGTFARDPPEGEEDWSFIAAEVRKQANSVRKVRNYLPVTIVGRGVDAVPIEELASDGSIKPERRRVLQLRELSQLFAISQASIDHYKRTGFIDLTPALTAASKLSMEEDRVFLEMVRERAGVTERISSWDEPGSAVLEVAGAIGRILKEGYPQPFVLFLSQSRYAKLLRVHERTGVMELQRLEEIAKVVPVPVLDDSEALLISANPQVLDLVVGADTELEYLGPEDGLHVFRIWETLAVRVRSPGGVCLLKQGSPQI